MTGFLVGRELTMSGFVVTHVPVHVCVYARSFSLLAPISRPLELPNFLFDLPHTRLPPSKREILEHAELSSPEICCEHLASNWRCPRKR